MKIAPVQSEENFADPASVVVVDPLQQLCDTLLSASDREGKAAARQLVSAMERPWEQLPSRLKSAARSDAAILLAASGGVSDLRSAGYAERTAEQLMRDLGRWG
jgi:hypothetical protein